MLGLMHEALHSTDSCPQVEVSPEELQQDPLMAELLQRQMHSQHNLQHQEQHHEQHREQHPATSSLWLDLETSRLLLRLHPDRSVRRQVYELAVQSRGMAAYSGMDQLADIRR